MGHGSGSGGQKGVDSQTPETDVYVVHALSRNDGIIKTESRGTMLGFGCAAWIDSAVNAALRLSPILSFRVLPLVEC